MTCAQKLAHDAAKAATEALNEATYDVIPPKLIAAFAIALLPYIKPFGCPAEEK